MPNDDRPTRDVQEARERTYARLRDSGASAEWARRQSRAAATEVQRGIDTGRITPPSQE